MICDTEMISMKELRPCPAGVSAAIFARRCFECNKVYFVNHKEFKYSCNACQEREEMKKEEEEQRSKEQQKKEKEIKKLEAQNG